MKVLVTGANGFIGTTLCRRLFENGHFVRSAVYPDGSYKDLEVISEVKAMSGLDSDTGWGYLFSQMDVIVHLAARVHVLRDSVKNPIEEYRKINTRGTERLARVASESGVKKFIFVSTAKVYGEATEDGRPFSEMDVPQPGDPYAISKLDAEKALRNIAETLGLDVTILQLPLVYGAGVKANFLRLMELIDKGIPLPLASVQNKRSLVYVENMASVVLACLENSDDSKGTFLVADEEALSTPELIRLIARKLDKPARLLPVPSLVLKWTGRLLHKTAEVERLTGSLCLNIGKVKNVLNWKPPFSVDAGIEKTVQWYKSR
jgi:nucleoside-diphosphate-sugar epimerase